MSLNNKGHLGAALAVAVVPLHGDLRAGDDGILDVEVEHLQVRALWSPELSEVDTAAKKAVVGFGAMRRATCRARNEDRSSTK